MTRVKMTLVTLALLLGAVGVWSYLGPQSYRIEPSRQDCKRTSEAKMRIHLWATWGGGPATISHSVTDQPVVGPEDHPAPAWETFVYARMCDLILLHVTPTAGEARRLVISAGPTHRAG